MRQRATENNLANELEIIYLIENFLVMTGIQQCIRKIWNPAWLKQKIMVEHRDESGKTLEELPEDVQSIITTWVRNNPERLLDSNGQPQSQSQSRRRLDDLSEQIQRLVSEALQR